ncbi:MAG: IPT/TIG domain-containing protein, partial [Candidatus Thiodiazotropha sp.]
LNYPGLLGREIRENLTIKGSGFGDYSNASNSGTSVSLAGETSRVISWSEQEIRAQAMGCGSGETVSVSSIHGSTTAIVE